MTSFDLVIRGGTVADGTGGSLRTADVAVLDGAVTEVGRVDGTGRREIGADGALVTPGWVDVHTHYDGQAIWDSMLAPSSHQGVTTVLFGNCGVGFAPVRPAEHNTLVQLMEGVEDIPGTALHEGLSWDWETFPQYLDALERIPHDIDFAAQIPHAALRVYVMGERGVTGQQATTDDIARMAVLAKEAIEAGALGFSTSRTVNHRSITGQPTPSLRAQAGELAGIAAALGETGRGVLQLVSDFTDLDEEWPVLMAMVEASRRPLSMSVGETFDLSPTEESTSGMDVLARISQARAKGHVMSAQVAPRPIGITLGLEATLHPFMASPVFGQIAALPLESQVRALREGELRERLLNNYAGEVATTKVGGSVVNRFEAMVKLGDPPDYEQGPEASITALAAQRGSTPQEVALDSLLEDDGHGLLYLPVINYRRWNLDIVRDMLTHPYAVPGLSDGGAHVGSICDVSFPTYLLAHWGRGRSRGRLPVEFLVERHTRACAQLIGLHDRGILAPGYRADINVIDFDNLALRRPQIRHDLPAGGRRFLQRADGYLHTLVAGVETYRDGEPTGTRPGRLIRGPQGSPS